MKYPKAAIIGDVLSCNNRLYCIERRVNPEFASKWLLDHGFIHTGNVEAKKVVYGLFEKPDRPRVAIPNYKGGAEND